MSEPSPRTEGERVSESSPWRALLHLLDSDPDRANDAYTALRQRLIGVFRWRALPLAEDLADEVFDRVVARLAEGEQIRSVGAFVIGVANRLAMEASRRTARHAPLDETPDTAQAAEPRDEASDVVRLERCLDELPAPTRELLIRYHGDSGRAGIAQRKRLAENLGIGLNALRIRVHRLRGRLQECLDRCRCDDRGAAAEPS
jgi:DNA-directed RNA polymerase specialized sigma24 family protein